VYMRRADGRIVADSSGSLFIQNTLRACGHKDATAVNRRMQQTGQ
jgi:hypothetical protein